MWILKLTTVLAQKWRNAGGEHDYSDPIVLFYDFNKSSA